MPEFDPNLPSEDIIATKPEFNPDMPSEDIVPAQAVVPEFNPNLPSEDIAPVKPASSKYKKDGGWVKDEEITDIAKRRGVDPSVLRLGVDMQFVGRELEEGATTSDLAKNILLTTPAGLINASFGNLAFKAFSKIAYDTKTREALDEVEELARKRQSYLQMGATFLVPGPSLVKGGAKAVEAASAAAKAGQYVKAATATAKASAAAAPIGAAYGYGMSKEGEELKGAAIGGVVAGALMPVGMLAGGAVSKLATALGKTTSPADIGQLVEKAQLSMEKNVNGEREVMEAVMASAKKVEYDAPVDLGKYILDDEVKFDRMTKAMMRSHPTMGMAEIEQALSNKLVEAEKLKLARRLEPNTSKSAVEEAMNKHFGVTGEEQMRKIYLDERRSLYMSKEADRDLQRLGGAIRPASRLDRYIGAQHVAADADRRFGTTFEDHLSTLTNQLEKASTDTAVQMKSLVEPLLKKINSIPHFKGQEGNKLLHEIVELGEEGTERAISVGMITREEGSIAREVAETFRKIGEHEKERGLEFTARTALDGSANYTKHLMVGPDEFRARVMNAYDNIAPIILTKDVRAIKFNPRPSNPDAQDLIHCLEIGSGKDIVDRKSFLEAANIVRAGGKDVTNSVGVAKAALERSGEIPEMVREYDIGKGFYNYLSNSNRTLALRDPIRAIKDQVKILANLGDEHYSKYMTDLVTDTLNGGRTSGIANALSSWRNKSMDKLVKLEKERAALTRVGVEEAAIRGEKDITLAARASSPRIAALDKSIARMHAAYEIPDLLNYTLRTTLFSNMMGGKIKAGVRDLLQPFTMGINEIGGVYGAQKITDGLVRTTSKPGRIFKWAEELQQLGFIPKDYMHSLTNMDAEAALSSSLMRQFKTVGDKYAKVFNSFRMAADITDRKIMLESARSIAKDYFGSVDKAKSLATSFVDKRVGPAFRTEIRRLERAGELTEDKLGVKLAEHLINRTQFRYNKAVAPQFARELGPLLTQFTKYPAEVMGSFATAYRRGGKGEMLQRAVYPLMAMAGMDQIRSAITDSSELSPREKVLLYRRGFTDASPIMSLPAMIPGAGPELTLYRNLATAMNNPDAVESRIKNAAKMLHPLGAASNLIEDIESMITGEEPEKD